jgi:hypothetical protein
VNRRRLSQQERAEVRLQYETSVSRPTLRQLAEKTASYARQQAGYAPTKILVLDANWDVAETISPETVRGLI